MMQASWICYCFCWIFLIFAEKGSLGQETSNCGVYEWQCKSGQCILSEETCDGDINCKDGSDETIEACLHVFCPAFAFRCAYGGCVSGLAECNGIQECADNSDELSITCPGIRESFQLNGNCTEEYFQCSSGECIFSDKACDGKIDCEDSSDETLRLCLSSYCPSFAFRCAYGACIDGILRCDGVFDCIDGSDESIRICGKDHTTINPLITPPTKPTTKKPSIPTRPTRPIPGPINTTPTTTTSTTTPSVPTGSCIVEDIPNLIVEHEADANIVYEPGSLVPSYTPVTYRCQRKNVLDGILQNFCLNGNWIGERPKCSKMCPNRIISGITFKATCEYNGIGISCNQIIRPGTRAIISCQIGYQKPDKVVQNVLNCDEEGEWDYRPFRCEQVCGTETVESTPFISGGQEINNTYVPWNVGIYSRQKGHYEQICGGTIVNAKVIISAAHCFWNVREGKLYDYGLFSVAAGKYFRDLYATEPLVSQLFNVSEIYVPDGYNDLHLSYQNDIAVLILNNFIIFNAYVKPICIEFTDNYSERAMKSGLIGKVAGWGKTGTEEGSSTILRAIDLSTIGYTDCVGQVETHYKNLVTGDKFCVSDENGESVCSGDSGGGFVIPRNVGGVKTYFLAGVVSNALTTHLCGGHFYTTFTNIQYHASLISEYESRYRPK